MSISEGKISAQPIRWRFNSGYPLPICGRCSKLVMRPAIDPTFKGKRGLYTLYNYMGTPLFIYESKSGYSIIYCGLDCRNKHNHRFNKGE